MVSMTRVVTMSPAATKSSFYRMASWSRSSRNFFPTATMTWMTSSIGIFPCFDHPKGPARLGCPRVSPVRITDIRTFGVITPDEQLPVFGGIFDVAVDASKGPLNGALYAVWEHIRISPELERHRFLHVDGWRIYLEQSN